MAADEEVFQLCAGERAGDAATLDARQVEAVAGDAVIVGGVEKAAEGRDDVRAHGIALPARRQAGPDEADHDADDRSEEHTSELQSLMRISYAVFCLKNKIRQQQTQQ